jgi:hypothetical protein
MGGGGGTGPLFGVGGGTCPLWPRNGGGTPYREPVSPGSYESSIGVFGGLGGGGGPGFDTDVACGLPVGLLFV